MIRRRGAGRRTVQAYTRPRVVEMASGPTKTEAVENLEAVPEGLAATNTASIVADVEAERR